MDEKISRMKELAATLTAAAKTYYQESREIMSNYEYDKLYPHVELQESQYQHDNTILHSYQRIHPKP